MPYRPHLPHQPYLPGTVSLERALSKRGLATRSEARALMSRSRVGTLVVVDDRRRLLGLLTERDLRFVDARQSTVADRMTPLDRLVVHQGEVSPEIGTPVAVGRRIHR